MPKDDLLTSLTGGRPHPLAAPLATQLASWLASSRRFTAFAAAHHSKIRKKLRTAEDPESLRDLRLELETAYLLLREKSLSLEYEPPPGGQARGPDFAVTFTTRTAFLVEVARLRAGPPEPPLGARQGAGATPVAPLELPPDARRFAGVLCRKLGQLQPQRSNLLLVGVEAVQPTQDELQAAMLHLQRRAEAGDAAVVQRHGFQGRGDFFHHYRRLSAVLVRGTDIQRGDPVVLWLNPQADVPMPAKVRTALERSHTF